ncbi:MAG: hypothetical protein N2319_03165 [Candidatus Kapabacteria bacterium]|nr:hypothetical protein [Candidatus Kapabacteria bacterium]
MKKLFAIAALVFAFAFAFNNASAQSFGIDEGTNWFEVYVYQPIIVTPLDMDPNPGITSRILGAIAPGTTKTYTSPSLVDIQFSVEGGVGADYKVDVDVVHQISTSGNPPLDNLTLNGLTWQVDYDVVAPGYFSTVDGLDPGSTNGDYTGWGPHTFTGAGRDIFRVFPTSLTAGPLAAMGYHSFAVTLTAYYI